jgi:hypothetical protein
MLGTIVWYDPKKNQGIISERKMGLCRNIFCLNLESLALLKLSRQVSS